MISGLVKAGTASWSNTKPTNNHTTVPTWNGEAKLFDDHEFDVFMYKRGSNPGDHCFLVPRLISGLTGRAREHLRMAGDLDRFAVDGGLEQFLEYLKTKWVFVDHRKREWHSRSTSTRSNVREVSP